MQHHATCGRSSFAWTWDKCIHEKLELQYLRGCLFRMSTSDVVLALSWFCFASVRRTMVLFASAALAVILFSTWSSVQSLQLPPQPMLSSHLVPNTTLSVVSGTRYEENIGCGGSCSDCTDDHVLNNITARAALAKSTMVRRTLTKYSHCNFLHSQCFPHTWCPIQLTKLYWAPGVRKVSVAGKSHSECTDEYVHPRDAQLSAARMFQPKGNMAGYTGSRVQLEKLTSLHAGHSFKIIEIENGGIRVMWPAELEPARWKSWYHLRGQSSRMQRAFARFCHLPWLLVREVCLWSCQPRHFPSPRLAGRRIPKRHAIGGIEP